uniref:SFRICE_039729 n=1 Tax=Spodoptera frugiperda TaxID=7108 RepID=A0A2H1WDA1_SPOFR
MVVSTANPGLQKLHRKMAIKGISLEDEYKKNTGTTPEDIKKLRDWLNTQPHLPGEYMTGRQDLGSWKR